MSSPTVAPPRPDVLVRLCRSARQLAAHFAVRRAVFVDEQGLFAGDDRDERDVRITTLHAIGIARGGVAGAVRLYPLGGGDWKGDRLAVLPEARHGELGARLVRFAVATAGERGGQRMVARSSCPTWASSRRSAGGATAPRSPSTASRTSRWRSRSPAGA